MKSPARSFFARAVLVLLLALVLLIATILVRTAAFARATATAPLEFPVPALDASVAASHLSAALRFETVSYDDRSNTPAFEAFRAWLAETYPRVHAALKHEVVGGGTLVYEWPGADASLKPIVLMAHQDVVPVAQPERWRQPPFSGAIVDGDIWGRGALDDKGQLIAIFEAVESLLAANHAPVRTVFLVFGHDEEAGGAAGARAAAQLLAGRGVQAEFVLDEGGVSMTDTPVTHKPMTLIGVSEKGYLTLQLEVKTAGGHSNAPGSHTAVDTLARALVAVRANPFPMRYAGVTRELLEDMAPHAPFPARMAIANSWLFESMLLSQVAASPQGAATLQTTIAPTMLQGSPKNNVLPSVASATINFRIMPGETTEGVIAHVRESIGDLPVTVTATGIRSEPSAIASTQSRGYRLIAGLAARQFDAPVAPLLMIGMTDSRYMTVLTDDVYRFAPLRFSKEDTAIVHGIDERISLGNFNRMLSFYQQLIVGGTAAQLP